MAGSERIWRQEGNRVWQQEARGGVSMLTMRGLLGQWGQSFAQSMWFS